MKYFLWLYLANIIHRVRWFGSVVARLSLVGLVIEHMALATHSKPAYYDIVYHYINMTWLVFILAVLFVFVPSEGFILNCLAFYKRDKFMRESFLSKILRLVKYVVKHDLLNMPYRRSIYQMLVTDKRIKWICIAMYAYEVYKGFKKIFSDIWCIAIVYAGFVIATWLYIKFTGAEIYYANSITTSMEWFVAIVSFLIFKVIFVPSFSVIRKIVVSLVISILKDKIKVVGHIEGKIDAKLASYEQGANNA